MPALPRRAAPVSEPPSDPLREALAAAIDIFREKKDAALAARAAVARARENVEKARARLDTARETLHEAQRLRGLWIIGAKDGGTPATDQTLRDAKREVEIATDDLSAAETALASLADSTSEPDADLARAEREVNELADAIMAEKVPAILAAGEALANALAIKVAELNWACELWDRCSDSRRRRTIAAHPDTSEALAALRDLPPDVVGPSLNRFVLLHSGPATSNWRNHAAVVALQGELAALKLGETK